MCPFVADGKDFASTDEDLVRALVALIPLNSEVRKQMESALAQPASSWALEFNPYDWDLNDSST